MCGIVGTWRRDGQAADPADVELMLATIPHRGPDGESAWHDGAVAFGHTRLKILDLTERAAQPMLTPDGRGVLIYNGEVYNYRELRRELVAEGIVFSSSGDTEVVLQALHQWGPEKAIPRLNGMFAFAYFDRRNSVLWLARDRAGIKPLIVAENGPELVFASEAKAILAHPRIAKTVDQRAVTWFLLGQRWQGSSRSGFAGVREIQPGTWWKVTSHKIEPTRYFHALDNLNVDRIVKSATAAPDGMVSQFARVLDDSIQLHLASDVPLATMCSGGVDSSLITACAKDHRPDISAYVADIPWPGGEAAQAELVGNHLGVQVHRVLVDRERYLRLWPLTVWHSDAPTYHRSDPALAAVTQRCREDGIKVLLTGEGADELFGGYQWYPLTYNSWRRRIWAQRLLLPKAFWNRQREQLDLTPFLSSRGWLDTDIRQRLIVGLDGNAELLPRQLMAMLSPIESVSDRALIGNCLYDFYNYLPWVLHRHDRMGMASSLEMRVPFLENDMIDLGFHFPRRAKLHRGRTKWVVKTAADARLPREIVHAKKKGFPVPQSFTAGTERLLAGGLLAEQLEWSARTVDEIVNLAATAGILRFHLVGLEIWLRIFFDDANVEEMGEQLTALAA